MFICSPKCFLEEYRVFPSLSLPPLLSVSVSPSQPHYHRPSLTPVLQKANTPLEGFRNLSRLPSRQSEPKAVTRVSRAAALEVVGTSAPALQIPPDTYLHVSISRRTSSARWRCSHSFIFPQKHACLRVNMHFLSSLPHWC